MTSTTLFPFAFAPAHWLPSLVLGITPATTSVRVVDDALLVRFGPWSLRTPLSNIAGAERTGGFAFIKTAGPPHLSFSDRGVTFATNAEAALCVQFHEPVPAIEPTGRIRHPGATMTVADPDGLARALGVA